MNSERPTGRPAAARRRTTDREDAGFTGFPRDALTFLADLSRNNEKAWFAAHRAIYDEVIVWPALAFIDSMGAALRRDAPSVRPDPRVGGSLFRIHRDTRFSADKRPYKTHVGIRFRDGDTVVSSKCTGPLFYVEFDAGALRLGVGVKEFDDRTLAAYRQAVTGKRYAEEFSALIRRAEANGHAVLGDVLTRPPSGFGDQPPNALLRRKGIFIRQEMPLPDEFHGPDFVTYCRRSFKPYVPLFAALRMIAVKSLAA